LNREKGDIGSIAVKAIARDIPASRGELRPSSRLDLSRFDASPFIAFSATKKIDYGIKMDGRIPPKRMIGFGARYCYLTAFACMCEKANSQGKEGYLKKGHSLLRESKAMSFRFAEEHCAEFSTARLYEV